MELVDTPDLKSCALFGRAGSSPASSTKRDNFLILEVVPFSFTLISIRFTYWFLVTREILWGGMGILGGWCMGAINYLRLLSYKYL